MHPLLWLLVGFGVGEIISRSMGGSESSATDAPAGTGTEDPPSPPDPPADTLSGDIRELRQSVLAGLEEGGERHTELLERVERLEARSTESNTATRDELADLRALLESRAPAPVQPSPPIEDVPEPAPVE